MEGGRAERERVREREREKRKKERETFWYCGGAVRSL